MNTILNAALPLPFDGYRVDQLRIIMLSRLTSNERGQLGYEAAGSSFYAGKD